MSENECVRCKINLKKVYNSVSHIFYFYISATPLKRTILCVGYKAIMYITYYIKSIIGDVNL